MQGMTIRYARQTLGLTQVQLANQLNSTQLSVHKWEIGAAKPKPETEYRIKQALGLSEEMIYEIEALLRDVQHRQIKERLQKKVNF
jgi:transcriptional regulator with XRE-family HTH domain